MTVVEEPRRGGPSDPAWRSEVADLVARVGDWVPTLRERSAECEALRRIPDVTVAELTDMGFDRIAQRPSFGGMGLGMDAVCEVAFEVGRGCCSTAWLASQWPGHQFLVHAFGEQAQQEYFATTGQHRMASTASAPSNFSATPVPGGIEVSGQMRFSSGCDHAGWLLLNAGTALTLVPRRDFEIIDDWHVTGLRGTGSKSVAFDQVFIPEHRTVPFTAIAGGNVPGRAMWDDAFLGCSLGLSLHVMVLAPMIGMARGLVELFEERALNRVEAHNGEKAFERPGVQLRFAEASAEVDAAVTVTRAVLAELRQRGEAGDDQIPIGERARLRRDIAFAAKLCMAAGDRLLSAGDASGQYDTHLFQRWGRDLRMASLQFLLTWDEPALSYSRVRWGLAPTSKAT